MTNKPFSPEEHFRTDPCPTKCFIMKYVGPGGDVVIPEEIGGLPVRGILDIAGPWVSVFHNKPVTSVTLPRTIHSLCEAAFIACRTLQEVFIPATLTEMQDNPFRWSNAMTAFHVDEDNPVFCAIDGALYRRDPLTLVAWPAARTPDVVIPEGVECIGDCAFHAQEALRSIQLPQSLREIGYEAFSGCESLTAVHIPDHVTFIDGGAFEACTSLATLTLGRSLSFIGCGAFSGCTSLKSVHVPDSVTHIGGGAFDDCPALTSLSLPGGVLRVYSRAMPPDFVSGHLPESREIGYDTPVFRPDGDDLCVIDGALCRRDPMTLLLFPPNDSGEAVVPEGIQVISDSAFCNFRHVRSVVLPDSVTTIDRDAFHGCQELTSIRLPARLASIGDDAFRGCKALTTLRLPEGLTSIGDDAFHDCTALTTLRLPEGFKYIGESAFQGCTALTTLRIPGTVRAIEPCAFMDCTSLTTVDVCEGVRCIWDRAFQNCKALEHVILPHSIGFMGDSVFYGCDSATFHVPEFGKAISYVGNNKHHHVIR